MLDIAANLEALKGRIAAAAQRAGRDPDEVEVVAVSKRIDLPRIEAALAAGARLLGESRVQEADEKIPLVAGDPIWHFIGPLQSNKAVLAARLFDAIHSVRRAELVGRLSKSAAAAARTVDVYVQVEAVREIDESRVADTAEICRQADAADGLRLRGLMTMAPYDPDPEAARPYFAALRRLRDRIGEDAPGLPQLGLSMGMSGDFEVAIEEGATIVRVGTAIFGPRDT
jgi:pyridoxal phosphate enzyme (YggS family)